MTCARCEGRLIRERMFDLPRKIHEFFCLNCGERFWLHLDSTARRCPCESEAEASKAPASLN